MANDLIIPYDELVLQVARESESTKKEEIMT